MSPYGRNQREVDLKKCIVWLWTNIKHQLQFVFLTYVVNPTHENQFQQSSQQKLKRTKECEEEYKKASKWCQMWNGNIDSFIKLLRLHGMSGLSPVEMEKSALAVWKYTFYCY